MIDTAIDVALFGFGFLGGVMLVFFAFAWLLEKMDRHVEDRNR